MALKGRYCQCPQPYLNRVVFVYFSYQFFFKFQECGLTGRKYTYSQLWHLTRTLASALTRIGCKKGDVCALILPNIPEFPVALLGAAAVGMPVALVSPANTLGCYLYCFVLFSHVMIG